MKFMKDMQTENLYLLGQRIPDSRAIPLREIKNMASSKGVNPSRTRENEQWL